MNKSVFALLLVSILTTGYANNSSIISNDSPIIKASETKTIISDHSSEACFNEDLYKDGVMIMETVMIDGSSETYLTTVKENQSFAGRKLIEMTKMGATESYKSYRSFKNGHEYLHGSEYIDWNNNTSETYSEPLMVNKISMQPGEVLHEYSDFPQVYVGRETLKTPLGTYSTCNFSTGDYNEDNIYPDTYWVFAEGPYRGLTAKSVWRELEEDDNGNLYIVQTNDLMETISVNIVQK